MPTLHLKGAPDVPLKENHSATRERFSLMTWCTSDAEQLHREGFRPPLEVLFKGKTARVLKDLELPASMKHVSVP